jgi:hypothetical protein
MTPIAGDNWFRADAATKVHGCIATFQCPRCQNVRPIMAQLNAIDAQGNVTPALGPCQCGFADAIRLIGWST